MSIKEILGLPINEKLNIAEQIWESLDPQGLSIPIAHKEETLRRIQKDREGLIKWHSLNEVKKSMS